MFSSRAVLKGMSQFAMLLAVLQTVQASSETDLKALSDLLRTAQKLPVRVNAIPGSGLVLYREREGREVLKEVSIATADVLTIKMPADLSGAKITDVRCQVTAPYSGWITPQIKGKPTIKAPRITRSNSIMVRPGPPSRQTGVRARANTSKRLSGNRDLTSKKNTVPREGARSLSRTGTRARANSGNRGSSKIDAVPQKRTRSLSRTNIKKTPRGSLSKSGLPLCGDDNCFSPGKQRNRVATHELRADVFKKVQQNAAKRKLKRAVVIMCDAATNHRAFGRYILPRYACGECMNRGLYDYKSKYVQLYGGRQKVTPSIPIASRKNTGTSSIRATKRLSASSKNSNTAAPVQIDNSGTRSRGSTRIIGSNASKPATTLLQMLNNLSPNGANRDSNATSRSSSPSQGNGPPSAPRVSQTSLSNNNSRTSSVSHDTGRLRQAKGSLSDASTATSPSQGTSNDSDLGGANQATRSRRGSSTRSRPSQGRSPRVSQTNLSNKNKTPNSSVSQDTRLRQSEGSLSDASTATITPGDSDATPTRSRAKNLYNIKYTEGKGSKDKWTSKPMALKKICSACAKEATPLAECPECAKLNRRRLSDTDRMVDRLTKMLGGRLP